MDLSNLLEIDPTSFKTALYVGIILIVIPAIGRFIWNRRSVILSKIKSLKRKVIFYGICRNIFQPSIEPTSNRNSSTDNQSLNNWEPTSNEGITLCLTRYGQTTTYYGVNGFHFGPPFVANNASDLTIKHNDHEGKNASTTIELVLTKDIERLGKQFHFANVLGKRKICFHAK